MVIMTVTVTVTYSKLEILPKIKWYSSNTYRRPYKILGQLLSLKFFTFDPYFWVMFKVERQRRARKNIWAFVDQTSGWGQIFAH